MTLSCLPKKKRQERQSRRRWRLPRRKESVYSVLKDDDDDCHWLLACQPPQPSVCGEQTTSLWKKVQSEATTSSDEDDNDDDEATTTTTGCSSSVSLGYDERGNYGILFSSMSLIHLAPPSETTDDDSDDADDSSLDPYTTASLAEFFRHIAPTDDHNNNVDDQVDTECDKDDLETVASSTSSSTDWKSTATNRSIRFADEVNGRELETIHIVPWLCAEDKDETWVPRRVRCRVEL